MYDKEILREYIGSCRIKQMLSLHNPEDMTPSIQDMLDVGVTVSIYRTGLDFLNSEFLRHIGACTSPCPEFRGVPWAGA